MHDLSFCQKLRDVNKSCLRSFGNYKPKIFNKNMASTMDPISEGGSSSWLSKIFLDIHPLILCGIALMLIFSCAVFYVIQSGLFAKIEVKTVQPKRGTMVVAYKTGKVIDLNVQNKNLSFYHNTLHHSYRL